MAKKYSVGVWNPAGGSFDSTNASYTKEVIKDAIDNNVNVLFVGGCNGCSQCSQCFTQISNPNNTINKDFLSKQEIFLVTYHQSSNSGTKSTMKSYIDSAASAKGISFSYVQHSGSSGGYSCHAVINMAQKKVYWVQAITSVSKSTIVGILGDVPKKTYYTVTFKDWNGTTLKTMDVEKGKDATPPSNPSRSGYKFIGWDKSYANITANTTVTAQYQVNDPSLNQKKYIIDSHCFSIGKNCSVITKDNVTLQYNNSNNTISPMSVTITFNSNGGTGSQGSISAPIGGSWTCPSCSFTRTDYQFSGTWNSNSSGTGTSYTPGQSYSTPSSNLTLYATWTSVKAGAYVVLAATETSPGCSKLNGMDNDIDRIKAKLPSSIPASRIIELRNSQCTTANIKNHLNIGKEYELLIYLFSDHGGTSNNGVMCTYDGTFKSADFYSIVSQAKGRVFAIFACCHAEDQYQATSPYALKASLSGDVMTTSSINDISAVVKPDDEDRGQYDWAQGAIDYFDNLKKQQQQIRDRINNAKDKGLLMAASPSDNAILAANSSPNMLCWCACKKAQVSYMSSGTGHYFITGLVNNFNSSNSYSAQWDAFANKSPAKGTTSGNTYTPVKAVLGTSFESKRVFT